MNTLNLKKLLIVICTAKSLILSAGVGSTFLADPKEIEVSQVLKSMDDRICKHDIIDHLESSVRKGAISEVESILNKCPDLSENEKFLPYVISLLEESEELNEKRSVVAYLLEKSGISPRTILLAKLNNKIQNNDVDSIKRMHDAGEFDFNDHEIVSELIDADQYDITKYALESISNSEKMSYSRYMSNALQEFKDEEMFDLIFDHLDIQSMDESGRPYILNPLILKASIIDTASGIGKIEKISIHALHDLTSKFYLDVTIKGVIARFELSKDAMRDYLEKIKIVSTKGFKDQINEMTKLTNEFEKCLIGEKYLFDVPKWAFDLSIFILVQTIYIEHYNLKRDFMDFIPLRFIDLSTKLNYENNHDIL